MESEVIQYNINIKSSNGTTSTPKKAIQINNRRSFKRSQTKIVKDEKNSLGTRIINTKLKKSVGKFSKGNSKASANIFLNTRELKSRGSTDNGIVVGILPALRNIPEVKRMHKFGHTPKQRSINLFKVAKELHKSVHEEIVRNRNTSVPVRKDVAGKVSSSKWF